MRAYKVNELIAKMYYHSTDPTYPCYVIDKVEPDGCGGIEVTYAVWLAGHGWTNTTSYTAMPDQEFGAMLEEAFNPPYGVTAFYDYTPVEPKEPKLVWRKSGNSRYLVTTNELEEGDEPFDYYNQYKPSAPPQD